MCKKLKLQKVHEPEPKPKPKLAAVKSQIKPKFSDDFAPTPSKSTDHNWISSSTFSKGSTSSAKSLESFKESVLRDKPILYGFKEITGATSQFTSGRIGKSSVYKSNLRGKEVAITVRGLKSFRDFRAGIRQICSVHHANIVKLLGGCCEGENVYLVYDYVHGASLEDCLRNRKMPEFTVLKTWMSRMRIATDVAQALEYMHHDTSMNYVHNYMKATSIIIAEPDYRAKICHVGASYLAGEYVLDDAHEGYDLSKGKGVSSEITEEEENAGKSDRSIKLLKRSKSMRITGTQGYMAPEYVSTGIVSQKNDVFAFGVILLELLSGHEPVRVYRQIKVLDRSKA
ncbi:lysM domain receptor-like kinase 3 isoform X1 [Cryptomeria japonica]|uniref:lysM domain receptor-like kinase 3 isoform X1 n=1 Tax=Cryptomeria japonica TaxID=3369 RepID=UPI0025AC10B0|nr:lysM domain receptor-like kinase 3 isoform X1 [Cryptomeria japonica]